MLLLIPPSCDCTTAANGIHHTRVVLSINQLHSNSSSWWAGNSCVFSDDVHRQQCDCRSEVVQQYLIPLTSIHPYCFFFLTDIDFDSGTIYLTIFPQMSPFTFEFNITTIDDSVVEDLESFTVSVGPAQPDLVLVSSTLATVTILDDDGELTCNH